MFDIFLRAFSEESVFQIKDRVYILILDLSPLIWHIRELIISVVFKHPVINGINIFCHIHAVKFTVQQFSVIIGNVTAFESLISIYKVVLDRIHPCEQRSVLEFKVEHTDQFFFRHFHSPETDLFKIDQPVLKCRQKALDQPHKVFRLFHTEPLFLAIARKFHNAFQMVVFILTVCRRIF